MKVIHLRNQRLKFKKLKTDLENAQSDLKDSEYDKYVSDQQKNVR